MKFFLKHKIITMKTLFKTFGLLIPFLFLTLTKANSQDYSFQVEVAGKGEPVILIPGLSCSGEVWDETVGILQKKYQCHILTLPGFAGQPPLSPMPDDFLMSVRDEIIKYIKKKNLQKSNLIGHSLGGFLSLAIASEYPDLISKIFVVDGLPFLAQLVNPMITDKKAAVSFAENMKQMMLNQSREQYEAMQPQMLQAMITDQDDITTVMEWGRKSDQETIAQSMYDLYSIDLRDDLARIDSPILVLGAWIGYKNYGATRENTLSRYQAQYEKANNATVEITDDGKHFIMWDDKPFYYKHLKSFFEIGEAVN
jgi:N-formylmaleamate deformylase